MAHLIRLDLKSAKAERSVRAECGKSYFNSRLFFCLGGEIFFGKGGGGRSVGGDSSIAMGKGKR